LSRAPKLMKFEPNFFVIYLILANLLEHLVREI
jgi:hypothetical protein